ncbi:hypothetical protein CTM88_19575 [Photobacterium aquimaris]|uniref:Uncharacterized protein n=2 Tax=Photobacterium TaxID=657 RepID=A0A2T3IF12_9GAMM|nr:MULTISPECIES: hypothetical protein [Photobacterium]OBU19287.1 hypothetical protein AYY20_04835 [Photobacterium aquimaris]PSU24014.1 hypothetical protein CTM88_19575 [Photobacterium aquimaris]SMY31820.1 hypothetical protein PMAL9190_00215 [Photobacterium malacitanum]
MIESTGKFKVVEIIYNKDNFAIAKGYWDRGEKLSLACRWHDDGIGYPQTFGKAQWMLLPTQNIKVDIKDALSSDNAQVNLIFS